MDLKMNGCLLILGCVGTAVFRSNGQGVLFVLTGIFIYYFVKKRINYKVMLLIIMADLLVVVWKGPVFTCLQVQQPSAGFAALPFVDGVWENIYQENTLPEEALSFVETFMPIEDFREGYSESYTNYSIFPNGYDGIPFKMAVKAWMSCMREHPLTTILARCKRTYNLWSIFPNPQYPENLNYVYNISDYTEIDPDYTWSYLPVFEGVRGTFIYLWQNAGWFSFISTMLGRCGVNIILCLLCVWRSLVNKKWRLSIVACPIIANSITLFVGTCFQDTRYFWPMHVLTVPFLLLFLVDAAKSPTLQFN